MPDEVYFKSNKSFIEVNGASGSKRQFINCTYQYYNDKNELSIITSTGEKIKFIGNFSAYIISMEDYKKTFNVHD